MPTIEDRLQQRIILMTTDEVFAGEVKAHCPQGWELKQVTDLYDIGDWNDVLLYRFLLLDLDEVDVFDPIDVIRLVRMQFQINLPVFCFGGDEAIQDEMRMARADRFFSRNNMLAMLPEFFKHYKIA